MEKEKVLLSQEELGIYLSCIDGGLEYNLPFKVHLEKIKPDAINKAINEIFSSHPNLFSQLEKEKDGTIFKELVACNINIPVYEKVKEEEFVRPFNLLNSPLYHLVIEENSDGIILFLDFHHIVMDGTSIRIFLDELEGRLSGQIKVSEIETSAFYQGEKEEVNREDDKLFSKCKDFYLSTYGNVDCESLPIIDKKEKEKSCGKIVKEIRISRSKVDAYRKEHLIHTSSFFYGVYAKVIALFSNATDAFFLTVNNGRDEESNNSIGMFVKSYPIYTAVPDSGSISNFIEMINLEQQENIKHSIYSFADFVNDTSIKPSSLFSYQGYNFYKNGKLEADLIDVKDAISDFSVELFISHDLFEMHISFRKDLYEENTITHFAELFENIANQFLVKENFEEVELMSKKEKDLLASFHETNLKEFDDGESVVDLFKKVADAHPSSVCLVYHEHQKTFKEVNEISNIIASNLISSGHKREEVGAILLPRNEYTPIIALAILKAGLAYQPLDATYPDERLSFMLKDSSASVLFTTPELEKRVEGFKGKVIYQSDIEKMKLIDVTYPIIPLSSLFALLYTSGSTGVPKGVLLEHKGMAYFIKYLIKRFGINSKSKLSSYASFGFDAGMMDIFLALSSGATLYIIDEEMRLDLKKMSQYLIDNKIDFSFFTTQVGRQMVLDYNNPAWKRVWTGGEKLVPLDPPEGFILSNAYGPTECTVFVTLEDIKKNEYRIPIGKPLDIASCYIVDKNMHELPIGIPGELCIAGPQVARGYLNRVEETNSHFVKNVFSTDKNFSTLYKTGDVVRLLDNGKLDIIGRKDSQVKIRGFRIELSEVEEIIRKFPEVVDATVISLVSPAGGNYLAAYIVGKDDINIDELKEFIGKSKPPYMVPSAIMQIDKIPLNQNGKVNKKALPEIKLASKEIVLPTNKREEAIYQATKEVLGDTGFGIKEDLFDYGLSSIGLMKLLTLLETSLKEDFSLKEIRDNKTIEKIALINHERSENEEVLLDYPLTKTQEGIFVESISNKDSTIYNIPLLQKLDNKIDLAKLEKTIKICIDNHIYLKSKIVLSSSGEARMKPNSDDVKVDVLDNVDIETLKKLQPFNILKDPLYRIKIIKNKEGNYLFMEFHHLLFDGASLAVFYSEMEKVYRGETIDKESKNGYQIAIEETKRRTKEELNKEKNYYESFLKGVSCDSKPRKEYTKIKDKLNGVYDVKLNLPHNLDEFICKNKLTKNSFYNSIFSFTLAKWNDVEEALYTTVYEGRDLASYSSSISMLVKTIPVYIQSKENETIKEYLKDMHEQILNTQSNTLYSFAELAHDLSIPSDILFVYQGDGFLPRSFAGYKISNIPLVSETPKSSFGVQIIENEEGSVLHFEYDRSLYCEEMPIHFALMMNKIIEEFINKKMLSEVICIDEISLKEIEKYNQTDDKPIYNNYEEAFQASVKKNLTRTAVIGIDERLTYQELDERSSIVANFLLKHGAKKDDKIIVMMPRIANAYVAIQGVLKAGSCFTPVDPKYPDDRVNYIIETAQSPFVITTKEIKEKRASTLNNIPVFTIEEILTTNPNKKFPQVKIDRDALAYCIFTSGSTGKPKGVMLENHSLVNYVSPTPHNLVTEEYLKYGHVTVAIASLSFDISVDEEMVPLCNGLTVMIASEDEILNPISLAKRMIKEGVDFVFAVPSYLNNALDSSEVVEAFKNVKCIKAGGEAFSSSLYRKIKDLGITAALHNVYGPTEITIANCRDILTDDKCITIGYPGANYKDYIIDKNNNLVPFGATGEILVAGEGVSRGYVGLDDLNKKKFINIFGVRAFKTGDIGRFIYDGRIDIFGRKDNQVKLRGLRVELDEIEANMNLFDGIDKAICLVKENPKDGQFLVGYYTAKNDINTDELKKFLGKTLTPYMIPRVFMKMDSFPTNNNGKVDKKALPMPEVKTSNKGNRKPKNELQEKIYGIYKKVLGIEDFSIDDDFFELGGSSLSASKVAMLAIEENLPLTYSDVFDNPSVADLYEHILLSNQSSVKQEKEADVVEENKVLKGLEYNDISHLKDMKVDHKLGRVLLFGATGFLGIHVLKALIDDPEQEVICLVRPGKGVDVESRVKSYLTYYFDSPHEKCFDKQICVLEGDLTNDNLSSILKDEKFDTIVNCAAIVKHFASDDSIERVNFYGVKNLISLALKRNCRLVQVSTLSVAGTNDNNKFPQDKRIHENEIFFGQDISNKYVNSKIHAEEAIEKAIEEEALEAKIVRVGNLMSRQTDGEFQINSVTNNFMNSLKAYVTLGMFPVSEADSTVDFSPIDEVAKTILLFAKTPKEFTIFHSANSHEVEMGDIVDAMNKNGFDIKMVDEDTFLNKLHEEMGKGNEKVSSLIRYNVSSGSASFILSDNSFSTKTLYILGYHWPLTTPEYLDKAVKSLQTLGFFEE